MFENNVQLGVRKSIFNLCIESNCWTRYLPKKQYPTNLECTWTAISSTGLITAMNPLKKISQLIPVSILYLLILILK